MYQYNDFDRQFVNERVAHYRDQTQRYLNGALSEDEFLQLRLRNGANAESGDSLWHAVKQATARASINR